MAVTIDSLELQIKHDSADAVKGINSLVRALRRLKEAAGMGADLSTVAAGIRAIQRATQAKSATSGMAKGMKEVQKATQDATQACDAHVRAWKQYQYVQERIKDMNITDGSVSGAAGVWEDNREVDRSNSVSYGNSVQEYIEGYKTAAEKAQEAKEAAKQQRAEEKALQEEANRRHKIEDQIVKDYEKQQREAAKVAEKEKYNKYKDAVRAFREAEKEKTRIAKEEARARAREEKAAMREKEEKILKKLGLERK